MSGVSVKKKTFSQDGGSIDHFRSKSLSRTLSKEEKIEKGAGLLCLIAIAEHCMLNDLVSLSEVV